MTLTSGRSIGSLTAGSTVIAKDQACCILLSGKGLITPPMRQVGNHLNTWQMHPNWSRHSTKLTQLSWPPRFIARGHCLIGFLYIFTHRLIILFLNTVIESLFSFMLQILCQAIYKSDPSPSSLLAISFITHSTLDSQADTSLIAPCWRSIMATMTPEASWAAICATRNVSRRQDLVWSRPRI